MNNPVYNFTSEVKAITDECLFAQKSLWINN
jgi:hypothetical protein